MSTTAKDIHFQMNLGSHSIAMSGFEVTSDGSFFVSHGVDKTLRMWDPIARKELGILHSWIGEGEIGDIMQATLSPDDDFLFYTIKIKEGDHNQLRVMHFGSGQTIGISTRFGAASIVSFTPDQLAFVIADYTGRKAYFFDYQSFRMGVFEAADQWDETGIILDFTTTLSPETAVHVIEFEWPYQPYRGVLTQTESSNGYRFVVGLWDLHHADHQVRAYHLTGVKENTPTLIQTIKQLSDQDIGPQGFTTFANHVAYIGGDWQLVVIDLEGKVLHKSEPKLLEGSSKLVYSPNGAYLLANYHSLTGQNLLFNCDIQFDPDGEDGHYDYTQFEYFSYHRENGSAVGFLNNFTAITGGGDNNEICLWNPDDLEVRGVIKGYASAFRAIAIDESGTRIGFGFTPNPGGTTAIEHAFNLEEELIVDFDEVPKSAFKRLSAEHNGNRFSVERNTPHYNGAPISFASDPGWFAWGQHGMLEDGRIVFVHGRNIFVGALNDHQEFVFLARLSGHTGNIFDVATSGNRLISGGADQVIRIWDLSQVPTLTENTDLYRVPFGNDPNRIAPIVYPMLNLFINESHEWMLWSRHRFYTSSPAADDLMGFHVNRGEYEWADFYPIDRFAQILYRPDVIQQILETGDEAQVLQSLGLNDLDIEEILPPRIQAKPTPSSTREATVTLEFEVDNRQKTPLSQVWVLQNGYQVWETPESELTDSAESKATFKVELELAGGPNQIEIHAKTAVSRCKPVQTGITLILGQLAAARSTSGGPIYTQSKDVVPVLYVQTIGVSKYKNGVARPSDGTTQSNTIYNLNYAHADATQLGEALKKAGTSGNQKLLTPFSKVVVKPSLVNPKGTKAKILEALGKAKTVYDRRDAALKKTEKQKKVRQIARDVTIIFLAGHGLSLDREVELIHPQTGRKTKRKIKSFYFATHETDLSDIENTALSFQELAQAINGIKSEVILMIDACYGGQIGNNFSNSQLTKRLQEFTNRPQLIFTATKADRVSVEHADWGHGAFTKGLIDVLKERRQQTILGYLKDVTQRVELMTDTDGAGAGKVRQMQQPTWTILGSFSDFNFKKVDS